MIRNEVCDDAKVVLMCLSDEFFDVVYGPIMRVDLVKICDMISMVCGGLIKW